MGDISTEPSMEDILSSIKRIIAEEGDGAVTRARRELKVFSGLRADDIDLSRNKAVGVAHLKAFLDYAVRGAIALPAQDSGSQREFESPFESAVAAQLKLRGWQATARLIIAPPPRATATRYASKFSAGWAGRSCGSGQPIGGSTRTRP